LNKFASDKSLEYAFPHIPSFYIFLHSLHLQDLGTIRTFQEMYKKWWESIENCVIFAKIGR